ncbi:MAG TPA: M48 family metalloprotease [Lacipirellulaceae bacterium]|nr:M48 family metalloprotease [Lacipirellulaceae bacterium]
MGGVNARMFLLIALVIALFAVVSYFAKPGDLNEVTGEVERVALADEADEIALGLQAAPEMVGMHGGPSPDRAGQQLVSGIGAQLLDALDEDLARVNQQQPEVQRRNPYRDHFRFTLLGDRRTVNAFALPGGPVFITQALYDRLETKGQLAGVLGHEIGHVLSRHGNKQMARQGLFQGLAGAVGVLGGDANSARMGQMVGAALSTKYGRDAELVSDKWGVRLMALAGYDPRALIQVMRILDEASGGGGPPEFLSTHPKPANRVAYIEQVIQSEFPEGLPPGLEP